MIMMTSINGKTVKCMNLECRYSWQYMGRLGLASCPSCGRKVKTGIRGARKG